MIIFPCATCGWFTNVAYNYSRINKIDGPREPAREAPAGSIVARDDITFESSTQRVEGTVGYAFAYVAPFAGIRGSFYELTLEGQGRLDAIGFPASAEFDFVNAFERNKAMALFGADVRIPSTKIYLRLAEATNGDDNSFTVNGSYGLF